MCRIPKMCKIQLDQDWYIASSKCLLKPLSKDITTIFNLFYEKVQNYHNNTLIFFSINTLSSNKKAKPMSTFDFLPYTPKYPMINILQY